MCQRTAIAKPRTLRLSPLSLGIAAVLCSVASFAQQPELEEILVTGSRIARSTFSTPAPVTVIDRSQLDASGATNLGEFLMEIPQTVSEVNSSSDVFSLNTSGMQLTALRNLGSQRTLVLVNGRRFVSGVNPSGGYAVDLNAIPTALIERVEILTGGTSAVYGSDAVAGVVNIIMRRDFEGVDLQAQGYIPEEGDRERSDISVTLGSNFERGNAWASFGYSNDEGMKARDRSFSEFDLAYFPEDFLGPGWLYLGSSFAPQGRVGDYNADGTPFVDNFGDPSPGAGSLYNRASARDLASPVTRRLAAAGTRYELADGVELSIDLNWSEVNVNTEFEPFPLDLVDSIWQNNRGGTGGLDVATSPLLPELLRQNLLNDGITNLNELPANTTSRRAVEFGNRGVDIDRTTLRVVGDLSFALTDAIDINVFSTWGKTDVRQHENVGLNRERAAFALDVEVGPDGELRCVSEAARLLGCVPFNPFGEGTISPEAVSYLATPQITTGEVEQLVAGAIVTGETPWALPGGNLAFAGGYEFREERGAEIPDAAAQSGITTSNRVLPTGGEFDVNEVFLEVRLPVLERLAVDAAYRVGDYSTVGTVDSWKLGLDVPVGGFRFRGTLSQSVRAPNVSDLFQGAGETFETLTDACAGVTAADTGNVAENCRSIAPISQRIQDTGAFTLSQVEAQTTGGFNRGNPDVQEETADAFTLGFVWTPLNIDNLSLAVDWYEVELDEAIAFVSRTDTVRRCFDVAPAEFDPECGGALLRDTGTGVLIEVNRGPTNEERHTTSGLDLEVAYLLNLGRGSLNIGLLYNYIREYEILALETGDLRDEAGEIQFPKNRANLRLNYALNRLTVDWRTHFIDDAKDSNLPGEENIDILGDPLPDDVNTCGMRSYTDARVAFRFAERLNAFLGVNNLFDKQPCILGQLTKYGDTGINTNPAMYDIDGRSYFIGFNYGL